MLHVSARADAALGQANAPVQSHWSFQKASEPAMPDVRDGAWPRSEVDRFCGELEAAGCALGQADNADGVFTWENAAEGIYEVRATVTDNRLAKGISEPVKITLTTGNLPPVIVSTYPAEGDFVAVPGKFTFKVVAYDPDGEVKSISVNGGKFVKGHGKTYWNENDDGQTLLTIPGIDASKSMWTQFTVDVEDNQNELH